MYIVNNTAETGNAAAPMRRYRNSNIISVAHLMFFLCRSASSTSQPTRDTVMMTLHRWVPPLAKIPNATATATAEIAGYQGANLEGGGGGARFGPLAD